jgi:hypothetical protein
LGAHAGLNRASVEQVAPAVAAATGRSAPELMQLLAGPAPADDAALVRLAVALDELEAAAGVPPRTKGSHP